MAGDNEDGSDGGTETGTAGAANLTREEVHDRDRAAFLAELGDGGDGEVAAKPKAKPAPTPAEEPDDEDTAELEPDDGTDADADDLDGDPEIDPDEVDPDALAAKDPDLARRMAAVRRTEQRQRQRMESDRQALEAERAELARERQAVGDFRAHIARAKIDPIGLLLHLGVPVDDLEYIAQQAHAQSKAVAGKPEYRAAAERAQRERDQAAKLAELENKQAERDRRDAERERQATDEREAEAYLARVNRVAVKTAETSPLTAKLIAKNPARARQELAQSAYDLSEKLGALPKPAQAIAATEKRLARQLRDLDIEAPARSAKVAAPGASAKPGARPVAKPAPAAAASGDGVSFPTRDEMIAEMSALDTDT